MMTRRARRAMSAWVLGVALFSAPAWADRDRRGDVPPIATDPPVVIHGGEPHGPETTPGSIFMMRDGVAPDSYKTGDLNTDGVRAGADRMAGAYPSTNVTRPSEILKPESGAAGIPLWRW